MFRDFWTSELRISSNNVKFLQFFAKISIRTLALAIVFFRSLPNKTQDHRMGTKTVLKTERFAFFDNSRFMTIEYCKACITALALPIQVSSSSSCLPSHMNCYTNLQLTLSGFLEKWSTSVLIVLIFIPALSHATSKSFNKLQVGDQIRWKKVKPDHLRTTNDWSCNFQSWHTRWFNCACLSSSCKLWKGEETKHTLAWDQRSHWMALIAYRWHEHRFLVSSRKT